MKLPIRVSEDSIEPIYHQIEVQIKALIIGGQLPPGTPLPSIRGLAHDLACSVITTRRAYQNLESQGFIKTIQGKGNFVNTLQQEHVTDTKDSLIRDSFEKAIEHGQQLGFTNVELKEIFERALQQTFTKDSR